MHGPQLSGRYADGLAACREAVAIYRVSDHARLGGALHDTAFMAVNAGEPLPDAEELYREALRFPQPNQPSYPGIMKSRIGMLRLRQGDWRGASACCGTRSRRCAPKTARSSRSSPSFTPAPLQRTFVAITGGRPADVGGAGPGHPQTGVVYATR